MSSVKAHSALILAVVFALGILSGVGGTLVLAPYVRSHVAPHTPAQDRERFIHHMQTLLDLSPQQTTEFTAIVQETADRWTTLHEQVEPQFDQIRQQQRNKVRAILTPGQLQKFNTFLSDFDARRKKDQTHRKQKRSSIRVGGNQYDAQIHRDVKKPVQNPAEVRHICLKTGVLDRFAPKCSRSAPICIPL